MRRLMTSLMFAALLALTPALVPPAFAQTPPAKKDGGQMMAPAAKKDAAPAPKVETPKVTETKAQTGAGEPANAKAADEPSQNEHAHSGGEAAADRRQDVEDADEQQRGLSAKSIGRPAAKQRTEHRAVKRGPHRQAVHARA